MSNGTCNQLPLFSGEVRHFEWAEPTLPPTKDIHRTLLRRACLQRNIKFRVLSDDDQHWIAYDDRDSLEFYRNMPPSTSRQTISIAHNKHLTKEYLSRNGVRTPQGITCASDDLRPALDWLARIEGGTAVVKPVSGSFGNGITMGVHDEESLVKAVAVADSKRIALEEFIPGSDHRLLVLGGRLIAAARRYPAHVVGDGRSTVRQLIDRKNQIRLKNAYTRDAPIKINDKAKDILQRQGLNLNSRPDKSRQVLLQDVANIRRGGDNEDVTSAVHPDFHRLAEDCWRAFPDMAFAGIDLIAEDITKPIAGQSFGVVEINTNCGLALHHFLSIPSAEPPVDVAGAIIDYCFPGRPLAPIEARGLTIRGKVQGVGYRAWLQKQARLLAVVGDCENRKDGSVKAFVQGSRASLDELVSRCAVGPEKSEVSLVSSVTCDTRPLTTFDIKASKRRFWGLIG